MVLMPMPIPINSGGYHSHQHESIPEPAHPYRDAKYDQLYMQKGIRKLKIIFRSIFGSLFILGCLLFWFGNPMFGVFFTLGAFIFYFTLSATINSRVSDNHYYDIIIPQGQAFTKDLITHYEAVLQAEQNLQKALAEQTGNEKNLASELLKLYDYFFYHYSQLLDEYPYYQPEKEWKELRYHMYYAKDFANQVLLDESKK